MFCSSNVGQGQANQAGPPGGNVMLNNWFPVEIPWMNNEFRLSQNGIESTDKRYTHIYTISLDVLHYTLA